MSPLRLNWCRGCGGGHNFGDQLGPILLRHFGYEVEWASPATAEIVTAGSILSKVPNGWRGTVLGTGFIRAGMHKDLSRARVLAVRGELTRKACGLPLGTQLGDLGVLVPEVFARGHHEGGAVVAPHYVDHAMVARHPGARVANVVGPPALFVMTISSADLVFTSTLHGLIAADALGVPHVLEPHGDVIGGMFKFQDYASALGQRITPYVERLSPRAAVTERQQELRYLVGTLR